jgi:Na+/H+ antiporter NhaC
MQNIHREMIQKVLMLAGTVDESVLREQQVSGKPAVLAGDLVKQVVSTCSVFFLGGRMKSELGSSRFQENLLYWGLSWVKQVVPTCFCCG